MNEASADNPLRIATVGLDERQCNALRLIFDGHGRKAYRLVEGLPPEAWIVDLDHVGTLAALTEQWRSHGPRPVLMLTVTPPESLAIGADVLHGCFLRKPFRIEELLALLPTVAQAARVESPARAHRIDAERVTAARDTSRAARLLCEEAALGFVGTGEDVKLDDPQAREGIYYAPARYLQHILAEAWQAARAAERPVAVEGPWPTFCLFPGEGAVELSVPCKQYRPFAIIPDLQGESRQVFLHPQHKASGECVAYQAFLWKLALWAARGRLPQGTPLDTPVYLRHWPNLTRLELTPSALAIAALWAREPHTLRRSLELLGIPQRWVFAFYSATHAVGLGGISGRAVDQMIERRPLPAPDARTGLLARVLKKLRLAA